MLVGNDTSNLPEAVLRLSKAVRFCAIIEKSGRVVASKRRKNSQLLVTNEDSYRVALHAAMRHFTTPSWATELGQMYYHLGRYEKVIGATIPLSDRYLLLVSFDHDTNSFDRIIMQKIMPIVKKMFEREEENNL